MEPIYGMTSGKKRNTKCIGLELSYSEKCLIATTNIEHNETMYGWRTWTISKFQEYIQKLI